MDRKREKEGGGCSAMKKEDKASASIRVIDVENVDTTGERCCHLS